MSSVAPRQLFKIMIAGVLILLSGCSRIGGLSLFGARKDVSDRTVEITQVGSEEADAGSVDSGMVASSSQPTPVTTARAFLDEANSLLIRAATSFNEGDFRSTEYNIKEAQQLLLDADMVVPSRTILEIDDPETEDEVTRHEAQLRLRDEFERLWVNSNALFDQLLPYLDIPYFETVPDQDGDEMDIEAMNTALEEPFEPAPGSRAEIRELLIQMKNEGRLDIDMELEDLPTSAWRTIYQSVSYYTGRGRKNFEIWLERSGRYQKLVEDILKEEELPRDLVYLCMIESGFSPRAYSRASAVGPWQFMSYTARKFGLQTSAAGGLVDERRDFAKSTVAASAYLRVLYEEFGSWALAMAAYNSGEGRVRSAQRSARRSKAGTDYWSIYRKLPRETRNYVPYYLAAMAIVKNTGMFGFTDIAFQSDFSGLYETVHIPGPILLDHAAEWIGADKNFLAELNPELRWRISPKDGWELRLPKGTTDTFITMLEQVPEEQRVSYATHLIRRGDTGSRIAAQWGVSWNLIRGANSIRNDRSLQVGQELRIPRYEPSRYLTDQEIASLTRQRVTQGSGTSVRVRIRSGDTISGLATRYGVTWVQIRSWNNLRGNMIYAGQTLRIYPRRTPGSGTPAVSTANLPADGVYTIGRNDTLWDISRRFGVSVADLKRWNRLTGNTIYPGRKLIVTREAALAAGMAGGSV